MEQHPVQIGPGPLSLEQAAALNQLMLTMTPAQIAWVGGYLSAACAGASGTAAAVGGAPSAVSSGETLTILVGSQTGNADGIAELVAGKASGLGLTTKVVSMGDFKPAQLKKETNMMVIVSTHGEGDPPDNAEDLHEFIYSKKAPKLDGLRFSVLALGDTSYEFFCKTGKDFDEQFEKLGGKRVADRVDCDVDFDDAADAWMSAALTAFDAQMDKGGAVAAAVPGLGGAAPAPASQYDRKNPYMATLSEKVLLNGQGSNKETWHLEFSLEDSGLVYQPGDALGVYPKNNAAMVADILKATQLDGSSPVGSGTLEEALTCTYDITCLSRPIIEKYNELDADKRVAPLLNDKNKKALSEYLEGREIIDLLIDFPIAGLTADQLVGILRKLPARLYSIASSLQAHEGEVHLTVGATRYETHGRERLGVCSTWLADSVEEGDQIPVYVDTNKNFKLPADANKPLIMIGPGTGVAPFRAFVEERSEQGAAGKNWLFFGDQHFTTDFLYQMEWQNFLKDGSLARLDVAFSRDQEEKVYVQDRMTEQGAELYKWIQEGAYIYVCGDADRMAPDVNEALLRIIAEHGNKSAEQAADDLKALQKDKRYQRDVY